MELTEKQKNCPYCHTDSDGEPLKYLKNNEDCSVFLTGNERHQLADEALALASGQILNEGDI